MLAFTSCDSSSILDNTGTDSDDITLYDQTIEMAASQTDKPTPKEVSESFFEMTEKVQQMSREVIDSLSNEEIMELGKPILDVTQNTIKLSESALKELDNLYKEWEPRIRSLSKSEHHTLSQRATNILKSDRGVTMRNYGADKVREILLNIQGGVSTMSTSCESMFNVWGGYVHLQVGDNFNVANGYCPAGSIFYVYAGTNPHTGQYVSHSKTGNTWVGVSGVPILDGQNTTPYAFDNGMANNSISWMEIRNYTEWGITSQSSSSINIEIKNMTFRNIASDKNSYTHSYGAIFFDYTQNVLVQYSYFNNVSYSVRFRYSDGPLQVLDNEALNTGFGFFQCNLCEGSNIKINNNSLEHTTQYGDEELHDFINLYDSEGSSSDYIQVINNRARVNLINGNASGVSEWGCAVLLGDEGGSNQEAKDNIGVNPGACGIGLASGSNMYVSNNKMYSAEVPGISNVGYYSINFYSPKTCSNH